MTDMISHPASEETDEAWRAYRDMLEQVRRDVLRHDACGDPLVRAQALYFLQMQQTTAFAKYIAPRHAYPHLYIHLEYMLFELTTGQSNPDFLYRWAYLDGRRTYRLWGRAGTTRWTDIQINNGFWGDAKMETVGNYGIDELAGDDGSFDVMLSARHGDGNGIRLDPESRNNVVMVREAWCDWESEQGVEMHIEAVDLDGSETTTYDEAEFNRRLRAAARYLRYSTDFSINTTQRILDRAGKNAFLLPTLEQAKLGGANPKAAILTMAYEIRADEALIVTFPAPDAKYWGISLGDIWFATTDYTYHQSSLNDAQASIDADGQVRLVIAHTDPGVANWLDVVGAALGVVLLRIYMAKAPTEPKTQLVKLQELDEYLPRQTARIDAAARRDVLARRKRGSLRRYGF